MNRFTQSRFPQYVSQIQELAEKHRHLEEEPLHLALIYSPNEESQDIHFLEVRGNFGSNEVSESGELFEASFEPTASFPMEANRRLYLVLTNPVELREARVAGWPSLQVILDAVQRNDYEVLNADEEGRKLLREVFGV